MAGLGSCARAGFVPARTDNGSGHHDGGTLLQMVLPDDCSAATWPATAHTVTVSPSSSLKAAIEAAESDTTILLEDGTHALPGGALLDIERVILRGASGDRSKVIVDVEGADVAFSIAASEVVVADLSIVNVSSDAFHIGSATETITGIVLFNLSMQDVADHFVHVSAASGHYADEGVVGCSRMHVSDSFRAGLGGQCKVTGIALSSGRGWKIFGNEIEGTWCPNILTAAIQLRDGPRDVLIERNRILDAGVGIRLGLLDPQSQGRTYADGGCTSSTSGYVDNVGGVVRNNFIATRKGTDNDSGIAIWNSCDSMVVHNTVFSEVEPQSSSIEWRFSNTKVQLHNNLVSHTLEPRGGATAVQEGNVTGALAGWFVDPSSGDLHLTTAATSAIDKGLALQPGICPRDIDGQARQQPPDVGADER